MKETTFSADVETAEAGGKERYQTSIRPPIIERQGERVAENKTLYSPFLGQ